MSKSNKKAASKNKSVTKTEEEEQVAAGAEGEQVDEVKGVAQRIKF